MPVAEKVTAQDAAAPDPAPPALRRPRFRVNVALTRMDYMKAALIWIERRKATFTWIGRVRIGAFQVGDRVVEHFRYAAVTACYAASRAMVSRCFTWAARLVASVRRHSAHVKGSVMGVGPS
jgi:hypothetical protein